MPFLVLRISMTYKNIKDFDKQANTSINAKLLKALNEMAGGSYPDKVKDKIVKRTQLGVGVDKDGNAFKLPALSTNYKEQRQGKTRWYTSKSGKKVKVTKEEDTSGYVKKPRLASTTTPAKANNTATGQLLKALTVVKVKVDGGVKFIFRVGDRRGLDGYGKKGKAGNKKIVQYLKDMGRSFFGFTKGQRNEISREIRQILIRLIK